MSVRGSVTELSISRDIHYLVGLEGGSTTKNLSLIYWFIVDTCSQQRKKKVAP